MEYRRFEDKYILRIDRGEDVVNVLTNFCREKDIRLGTISGIGAASLVEIGLFNVNTKEYKTKEFNGMFEITSLMGNITEKDNNPYLHIHINFSNEEGNCFGGHLVKSVISATCEIVITESIIDEIENSVNREFNEEIGLNLLKF